MKLNPRSRIPDDQVHFAGQIRAAKQRGYLVGILRPIVYPAQQNILKGHPFLRAKRHLPHRVEHVADLPFTRYRHNLLPNLIVRRVQRDCQLRTNLLGSKT